jgi:hypothetical protein
MAGIAGDLQPHGANRLQIPLPGGVSWHSRHLHAVGLRRVVTDR